MGDSDEYSIKQDTDFPTDIIPTTADPFDMSQEVAGRYAVFASIIRKGRLMLLSGDSRYSQRQTAIRLGIDPTYLSRLERGLENPRSEETIIRMAHELRLDPDWLLGVAGRMASDLRRIVRSRPVHFARVLRTMHQLSMDDFMRAVQKICDGNGPNAH